MNYRAQKDVTSAEATSFFTGDMELVFDGLESKETVIGFNFYHVYS